MGKEWDRSGIAFHTEMWQELYRVLKPGAHILVAGIARTHHRMWVALEDAGFEIRDGIYHVFGSGFPKSTDISKQLDKMAGEKRQKKRYDVAQTGNFKARQDTRPWIEKAKEDGYYETSNEIPISREAIQWNGWGTALKPSVEIWCLARKPISECNIAANVLKWECGGINVDGCKIGTNGGTKHTEGEKEYNNEIYGKGLYKKFGEGIAGLGRFPANLILECCCEDDELVEGIAGIKTPRSLIKHGSGGVATYLSIKESGEHYKNEQGAIHTNPACVCRMLDEQSKNSKPTKPHPVNSNVDSYEGWGSITQKKGEFINYPENTSGASRFFYQAKASQKERWFYCTICKQAYPMKERDKHVHDAPEETKYQYLEVHPTQKPLQLIQYLTRLITPPHGTVLDLFMGTGTTLVAAEQEGFNSIGVDSKYEYCRIAERRLQNETIQSKINQERSTIEKIGF